MKDATKTLTDEDGVFENDVYNVVQLDEAITTTSIRLLMTVRTEPSTVGSIGCYRWKVIVDAEGVAENVINLINKIGTVECTQASRKLIYEARNAYDSLSDAIKEMITNYEVLQTAEATYEQLCEDAAAPVISAINQIGTVTGTDSCKELIDAARTAYEALTRAQKARVSNYDTLTAAEEQYADMAAAASVDALIDAIGTVTATDASKALIDAVSISKLQSIWVVAI
ncbi:MAG: hypothetical protein Q4B70_12000 [Lachnospiraceae bacterium]|nr:hypothetical protein [Lachnospiraceae bacterium]